jgi:hypothetical protein
VSKPIAQKLGLKPAMHGWAVACPEALVEHIGLSITRNDSPDVILAFASSVAEVMLRLAQVLPHYQRGKALWFAYPKKTGVIKTDITRDHGWEPLAAQDLLPVMQIAIDDTWSALRFRYRDEISKLVRKADLPGKRQA